MPEYNKGMHKHHIIPRHMGGTEEDWNLTCPISVEDHAIAHLVLYRRFGNEQDLIAYKMLSGQISSYEASREACRVSNLGNNHFGGRTHSPEARAKISAYQKVAKIGNKNAKGHKKSKESKRLIAEKAARYMWITNDQCAKQWLKTEPIPEGYRRGRGKRTSQT